MQFHDRCGDRVTLLNDKTTAVRSFVEFNHGLILSAEPLTDDTLFEVCVERKIHVWNGSLEIGVTTLDPDYMELPATATKLRNTAWILSGCSIVKDGVTIITSYGPELNTLREGDCLGVMRTCKAELMFYVNGKCLGIAATDMPQRLFAVIDLYGQCVQVSIIHTHCMRPIMESSLDQIEDDPNNDESLASSGMEIVMQPSNKVTNTVFIPMTTEGACALVPQDHLRFHPRCGLLVKLSDNNKTAERLRPLDDYNNGVVLTHRPLYDNELFEIRIDTLVDKWSGSIEVGITTHNPATMRFPSTMTNMESGTVMMSGSKILVNGQGSCIEYGNFNLDELKEGDTIGLLRKPNGKLHYFINGVDQGVATDKADYQVWGVVDLYGMTVKVTIVDPSEYVDSNINNVPTVSGVQEEAASGQRQRINDDSLLFHTLRDSNIIIINDGKTAHRPNAFEFFNNGIVMTNRSLKTNELFQVRLDLVIPKWAGSIEIGVTQHSSNDIQFPFKMSNAKSGTWVMTGEDIIHDGIVIIPQYVRNLNRLAEGATVGVMRKDMGILHFFVNGVDQGPAAFNIPEHVFGIIDLYGRVAQATILDVYLPPIINSPETPESTESNAMVYPEMCFHRVHGRNARLSRNRLTASRAAVYAEFNDAVLFSSRSLRECEMFEIRIDKMIDCWIGSLEIGVTAIRPDDLAATGGVGTIAGTATDLNWDTYILSGTAMMKDGECVRRGYPLDLDTLTVGSRIGMMWHADRSLHYYLDGMDMGRAWYVPHLNIYAVVDLYGQCAQVTILQNEERAFNYNGCANSDNSLLNSRVLSSPPPPYWSFSEYCGENVCLMNGYSTARRLSPDPMGALVFSSFHLAFGEIYEVKIMEIKPPFTGSFRMGVTDVNILNAHVNRCFPPSVAFLPHYTAYIDGKYMRCTRPCATGHSYQSFVPSFEWLRPGDRIGLKKVGGGRVLIYYNSELLDMCFEKVPDRVYAVMELYGSLYKIQAVPKCGGPTSLVQITIPNDNACCLANDTVAPANNEEPGIQTLTGSIRDSEETVNNVIVHSEVIETIVDSINIEGNPPNSMDIDEIPANPVDIEAVPGNSMDIEDIPMKSDDEATNNFDNDMVASPLPITNAFRQIQKSVPYTFYGVHGRNLKLRSSDTVAVRTKGYRDGIAIVSTPLFRGKVFRFRVDRINNEWSGSVLIGAVGKLPTNELPCFSLHLDPPAWIISCDELYDDGNLKRVATVELNTLKEQSILMLKLDTNGVLSVDIDGKATSVTCKIPEEFGHIYPLVDVYGKVEQVSILLHPLILKPSTSFDLLTIFKTDHEMTDQELRIGKQEFGKLKLAESSIEDQIFHETYETNQPGTSNQITEYLDGRKNIVYSHMRRSITFGEKTFNYLDKINLLIRKSSSVHNFCQVTGNNQNSEEIPCGPQLDVNHQENACCENYDTNIQHNHRYPEQSSFSLDSGDASPDSFDDDLHYFCNMMTSAPEMSAAQFMQDGWPELAEKCSHLRVVLNYLEPFRETLWVGHIQCYCSNCQPDAQPPFTGWVRIGRSNTDVCSPHRAYWHVRRSLLSALLTEERGRAHIKRPRPFTTDPISSSPLADVWFDDENKGHYIVFAMEIDVEISEPKKDRLLSILIHLRPW